MRNVGWIITAAVLGSTAFYLPAVLLRVVFDGDWAAFSLIPLTVGLPLLLAYLFKRFRRFSKAGSGSVAVAMIVGIWITGPIWLGILALLSGAGKGALPDLHQMLLFPIYTFMQSTYSGLLWAVQITTVLLIFCGLGRGPFRSVAK